MASTLRHRHRHPTRSDSDPLDSVPSSPNLSTPSDDAFTPRPVSARPRSYSLHQSRVAPPSFLPFEYGSSLLESLDLPGSIWTLRDLLLERLTTAEDGIKQLRAFVEESESEGSNEETDGEEDEEDWEVVTSRKNRRKPAAGSTEKDAFATSPLRAELVESAKSEISTLEAFVATASTFLATVRAELPSLSHLTPSPSPSLVQFQLSDEARQALDEFLEDHPLPSFPQLDLRTRLDNSKTRAANSATALLSRASSELAALQDVLAYLTQLDTVTSYMPSLPSLPPLPSPSPAINDLREYFSSESTRLGKTLQSLNPTSTFDSLSNNLRTLRDETSDSLQAGIAYLEDGANELGAKFDAALDEAAKMYHAALAKGKEGFLRYEELPMPWRNNEHILTGYRFVPIEQTGSLLASAFTWHNETINIQSHLIGALSLIYCLFFILPSSPHWTTAHPADTAVALLFLFSAMKCLLCSAAWHLLSGCATGHWHRGAACVDYVGISGLIAASVMGVEYYGFYCRPDLATAYMTFSAILGVTGMILPWKPWFNERKFKMWRIAFFLGLAGSAATPLAHISYLHGFGNTVAFFYPAGFSVLAYLIGLSFYANQFPECAAPGRWDNLFASHQLWHIAIVCAVWIHWSAMGQWAELAAAGQDLSCAMR